MGECDKNLWMLENCRFSCQSCLSNGELHEMCRVGGRSNFFENISGSRRGGFRRNGRLRDVDFDNRFGGFNTAFNRWNRDAPFIHKEDQKNSFSFFMAEESKNKLAVALRGTLNDNKK